MRLNTLKKVIDDEDGAVTVDWVVLTATIVGLTVMAATTLSNGTLNLTGSLVSYMSDWDFE